MFSWGFSSGVYFGYDRKQNPPSCLSGCCSWEFNVITLEGWCWRSNPSILKEISTGCSLEGLMLKLKLQYFTSCEELTYWKRPWCWEGLGAGGEGDDRGWDGWMASLTRWAWVWVNSRSWWWTERPGVLRFMGSQRVGHDWATELNWLCKDQRDYFFFLALFTWISQINQVIAKWSFPSGGWDTEKEWPWVAVSEMDTDRMLCCELQDYVSESLELTPSTAEAMYPLSSNSWLFSPPSPGSYSCNLCF